MLMFLINKFSSTISSSNTEFWIKAWVLSAFKHSFLHVPLICHQWSKLCYFSELSELFPKISLTLPFGCVKCPSKIRFFKKCSYPNIAIFLYPVKVIAILLIAEAKLFFVQHLTFKWVLVDFMPWLIYISCFLVSSWACLSKLTFSLENNSLSKDYFP